MICHAVVTKEETWFVAVETETNVSSQGKTEDEALANLKEALALYFEIPDTDLQIIRDER